MSDLAQGMTTAEVAQRLGTNAEHVRDLIAARSLEAVNIAVAGRRANWRVMPEALERFIAARTNRPAPRVKRVRRRTFGAAPSRY